MPIYSGIWDVVGRPRRAVVVFVHCFGSHMHDPRGFEDNLLRPLAENGYVVCGFDLRGHGRTGTAAGNIGDIGEGEARMEDLRVVVGEAATQFPGTPLFLLGHSMGGSEVLAFMSLRGASPEAGAVRGLVLLAPNCEQGGRLPSFLRFLIRLEALRGTVHLDVGDLWRTADISKDLSDTRLNRTHLDNLFRTCDRDGSGYLDLHEFGVAVNRELGLALSPEETRQQFQTFDGDGDGRVSVEELKDRMSAQHPEDAYCLTKFRVSNDFSWYERAMDASRLTLPCLLVHGEKDRVNDFEAARAFLNSAPSNDKTIKAFANLRHGVAMDMDAPQVLQEVLTWLDART